MRSIITLISIALFISTPSFAATGTDWRGRVLDDKGEALPYANAVLLSLPDSTVIAGTTTGEDGSFIIESDRAEALLMISMIGFKTAYSQLADCGTIKLEPDTETLGEASISAVMPKTKLTDQGLLTSVRGSALETVGTANDALARVPGLTKGQNGLEVLGKGAPLVYINGRRMTDSKELDRLQSNEIQSVEVITNPGAQYNASVRSVVRIKTIKHQGDGFSFNAGISDDQSLRNNYNDPSAYLNLNFRHNGLDIFAGGNALKFTSRQQSDMLQQTFGNPGFKQEGTLDFVQIMNDYGINGGLNWQVSDNHSLGFRIESSMDPRVDIHQVIDECAYRGDVLVDKLLSEGNHHIDNVPYAVKANAYYNGNIGKLNVDFNADYYGMKDSQDAHTKETSAMAGDDEVDYMSHSNNRMYAAKLILSYPIWKGAVQAGTEDIFSRRSDDYTITSTKIPSSKSNVKENNIALFATYGFYIPKAGQFSAGVRYEHVGYFFDDLLSENDITKIYDNFFPTVSWANAFGPVQMQLSYSAKTTRPDFSMLSSSIRYHSRYILQSGNARLQPQTNHDLGLNLNWKFLTMVTQYSRINDAISQWSELYNDEGIVIVRPVNLESPMRTLVWFINASPTIGVWTMNYTAGVQQQWLKVDSPDVREPSGIRTISFSDKPMWIAQMFNTFRFKGGWQLELGGEYHSIGYSQNSLLINNFFNLTAAVQKSFLDNSLVVRLAGNDLAGCANYDVMSDCGSHIIRQTNLMDNKRLTLSIRYNFNTASSKYKGTGAGQETARRMGR